MAKRRRGGEAAEDDPTRAAVGSSALDGFRPPVQDWFRRSFDQPTLAQERAWPAIRAGQHSLLLAPTGSGKTLAAFLVAIDRIMFGPPGDTPTWQGDGIAQWAQGGTQVVYISPLKALGVDVERNLRAPLAGVRAAAERLGVPFHEPRIGVRTGDTSSRERTQLVRHPPDILITTPESLYLLLTSRARATLTHVHTVIIDEIHSLVPTKRGAHLFLTLERLHHLVTTLGGSAGPQRIGLSATQRPLYEVARLLGGGEFGVATESVATPTNEVTSALETQRAEAWVPRPVTLIEAGTRRPLELRIEVPVEDMSDIQASLAETGPAAGPAPSGSIWAAIHPRLVELIRQHRSTMIFVNSRRLAERMAATLNELADAEIALAHHGSIAKETRADIEDRLKRGLLPAIVATSSLELGIDMGAVDLVVQVEAPPSIASGLQRIGRAGHHVGGTSAGVIFPKFRGDLLACAAAADRMLQGLVEETFYPRNPLDVLAQQIVAMVNEQRWSVDDLFRVVCQAAPFQDLPRAAFEGVLDLLAGRYPSEEFHELRPRLLWDRIEGTLSPRRESQRLAVLNAGTIPDRGLFGVFLATDDGSTNRVGELDEEMVFEMHSGDVFLLGASSWRVVEITHDRVLVTPAPGEAGKMPFWRGDGPGRPAEFGAAIGALSRQLVRMPPPAAAAHLTAHHRLDDCAARNLVSYLHEQREATEEIPTDKVLVAEMFLDEIGDWRVAILSPFGSRVHAPWAAAVVTRLRGTAGEEVDMTWTDDGMVFRVPSSQGTPDPTLFFPSADEIEELVVSQLGTTALFAGRFRENAARALLLPRRSPKQRTPLWLQRRRSADLLAVAAKYPSFPLIMETYRECLRDIFDLGNLRRILAEIEQQAIRVHWVETTQPSPFAASLLFGYVANFIYQGDTPLAERRARALTLDHGQLSELLGTSELREMLCPDAVDELARELQRLDARRPVRDANELHDLLRELGDLRCDELIARIPGTERGVIERDVATWLDDLQQQRRALPIRVAGETRWIVAEDAARYRDGLGVPLPLGLPQAFLQPLDQPWLDLIARYARTHVAFRVDDLAQRWSVGTAVLRGALEALVATGRLLAGEFLPGGSGHEWIDPQVLRMLKRRSVARWRRELEPVDPRDLARFLPVWQGLATPRRGLDGLLDVLEQLQGLVLPYSVWEQEVLPRRVEKFQPDDLDQLCAAGEIVWRGIEPMGADDGRISLYLHDHFGRLAPPAEISGHPLAAELLELLARRGAMFFDEIHRSLGQFPPDVLDGLWQLVWAGQVTNDTLSPLRSRRSAKSRKKVRRSAEGPRFRSRRSDVRPGAEGRWTLLPPTGPDHIDETARRIAMATQCLERYGIVTRNLAADDLRRSGFAGLYPVLKAMEEAGRIRRGYFVAGLGAAQFAAPGAEDRLRQIAQVPDDDRAAVTLPACDPANPYGTVLDWPPLPVAGARPQRVFGARVLLLGGELVGYWNSLSHQLIVWDQRADDEVTHVVTAIAACLATVARDQPVLLERINGVTGLASPYRPLFQQAGFFALTRGLLCRPNPTYATRVTPLASAELEP